jgi:hypothetical protein
MTYGQNITYTDFFGNKTTCGVDGCETPEQALREAVELAEGDGWTNPKWWQWWRRGDTKITQNVCGEPR